MPIPDMTKPLHSTPANQLSVSNTKLAACLAALGFQSNCKPLMDVATEKTVREFRFTGVHDRERRPQFASLSITCAKHWTDGTLEQIEPMHPLCVMMRAMHNYDRLLDMHRDVVMNLRSAALLDPQHPEKGGRMTVYKRGSQPDPRSNFSAETLRLDDLQLVAALAGVGIPVLSLEGAEGSRIYTVPRYGYALAREDGTHCLVDAMELSLRAPTPQDPRRLALEDTDPLHPVVLAYDALTARSVLKKLLQRRRPNLHIQDGGMSAILTSQHTGRVMDILSQRYGLPSL